MARNKYRVDLPALMRLYDINYANLRRLLPPENQRGNCRFYEVKDSLFQLEIIESTRYTSLVVIVQCGDIPDYLRPILHVRMYHDARVAEVCRAQQASRIMPRYDYPNSHMHQRNEKHQVNAFLAEWLRYCLRYGISKQDITF